MPAQPYQQKTYPLANRGLVLKADVALLQDGQFQQIENITSVQEGTLCSRNGYRKLNSGPFVNEGNSAELSLIHTLGRVATGSDPETNYRYLGEGADIYRINSTTDPEIAINPIANLGTENFGKRWTMQSYRKNSSGFPYGYFATVSLMLKDPLTDRDGGLGDLLKWGVDRPVIPASAVSAGANADGPSGSYRYVYTLRNPITGHEGNPSMIMPDAITVTDENIDVTVWTTCPAPQLPNDVSATTYVDPQIYGPRSIAIYRAGGDGFFDNLYRLVGYVDTSSAVTVSSGTVNAFNFSVSWVSGDLFDTGWAAGTQIVIDGVGYPIQSVDDAQTITLAIAIPENLLGVTYSVSILDSDDITFTDTMPDNILAGAKTVDFDNDPPVTSQLPVEFFATISSFTTGGGSSGTTNVAVLDVQQGLGAGQTLEDVLRPGTVLTIGDGDSQEQVVLWAITADLSIQFFPQFNHSTGDVVRTASVSNQPCFLSAQARNSQFLAGDVNNPNFLYKSKTGRPEAFPVINLADGSPGIMEVGTPENPIMAITDYDGQIVCLNKSSIFLVQIFNGFMQTPVLTPAQRGLVGHWAWCRVDNEIWYLSYDGIYAWSGGLSMKKSEAIDPIFKGEYINGYIPIDMSEEEDEETGIAPVDRVEFDYYQNEVIISYRDVDGDTHRLRYNTIYDRWLMDDIEATAMLFEPDTGDFIFATSTDDGDSFVADLQLDNTPATPTITATTDAWTNDETQADGEAISWSAFTGFFHLGEPTLQKQWGDIALELSNPSDGTGSNEVTVEVYYDFSSTADAEDTFTISNGSRRRVMLSLKSAHAQEAWAVAFKFSGTTKRPVQLFSVTFSVLPLEKIQRGRADDWSDDGYPYDKRLQQVTIEFDTGGYEGLLHLDTMNGIGGNTFNRAVQDFVISNQAQTYPPTASPSGPLRAKATFAINDGIIAKLMRIRPTEFQQDMKIWGVQWLYEKLPPDVVKFSEWTNIGWDCEKVVRTVVLDVDTGGVPATVHLEKDSRVYQTFNDITTTLDDRVVILSVDSEVEPKFEPIGRLFRTVNEPGSGGKFQLFNVTYHGWREPCRHVIWDSFEQHLQADIFKFLKQMWVTYRCETGLIVEVWVQSSSLPVPTGQLLYTTELPAHFHRDTERFYLPVVSDDGVLNKSKQFRIRIKSCDVCIPFVLYKDASFLEWMAVGADQRQGYQQFQFASNMDVPGNF